VEATPRLVRSGEHAEFSVSFNPGFQGGRRKFQFSLRLDSPVKRDVVFSVVADLIPEIEIERLEEDDSTIGYGKAGRQQLLVISRTIRPDGLGELGEIACDGMVTAEISKADRELLPNGTVEARAIVLVQLPPSYETGEHRSTLQLKWPNGRTYQQTVMWKVAPRVTVTPAGIVVKAEEKPRDITVVLHAAEVSFRVMSVECKLLKNRPTLPSVASRNHRLDLSLDTAEQPEGTYELRIMTDLPDDPVLRADVMVLPVRNRRGL
jgi:hypothetical protein